MVENNQNINLHKKPKVDVQMLSKTPIIIIAVFATFALTYMMYAMSVNQDKQFEQRKYSINEDGFNFLASGSGLALGNSSKESGIIAPTSGHYDANGNFIPNTTNTSSSQNAIANNNPNNRLNQQQAGFYDANGNFIPENPNDTKIIIQSEETKTIERNKRINEEEYNKALSSPLIALKGEVVENNSSSSNSTQTQNQNQSSSNLDFDISSLMGDSYDPSANKDKEEFFSRAQVRDGYWTNPSVRTVANLFELKTGGVIPAILVTGANSDLPGQMIAQVSQNVYDTSTGKYLIIPQGSKLYGSYDSRVTFGQSRVLVAWNRIIFPDGSAMTIPAMQGADMAGTSGFNDKVNNHYVKMFGTTGLMALLTTAMTAGLDSTGSSEGSIQSIAMATLATQIGQTAAKLLEKNMSIQPTLEIRPGYRFNIVVTQDLLFDSPYTHWGNK